MVAVLAFGIWAERAAAATGTLSCTVGGQTPATIECSGSGWTAYGSVGLSWQTEEVCGSGSTFYADTDEFGDIYIYRENQIEEAGEYSLYASEDECATYTPDPNNPWLVEPPPVVCGDGSLGEGESCDDGNTDGGDGCSSECSIESGWRCEGEPSYCYECGDGTIYGEEECDDGNYSDGDGCNSTCSVESGWICEGEPSQCSEESGPLAEPFLPLIEGYWGSVGTVSVGMTEEGATWAHDVFMALWLGFGAVVAVFLIRGPWR